jgi:hypothetical protein
VLRAPAGIIIYRGVSSITPEFECLDVDLDQSFREGISDDFFPYFK